jgi:uncharacterized protein (TIGR03032 family)
VTATAPATETEPEPEPEPEPSAESQLVPADEAEVGASDLALTASPGFADWLASQNASLTFATPPAKVFFVGIRPDGDLGVFERTFDKAMGVSAQGSEHVWLGTRSHLWRLDSMPLSEQALEDGFDRCYVPKRAITTGYLNTHDVSAAADGDVIFVATRFCVLAKPSETRSFDPYWQPPWLDRFEQGDRCHLNGFTRDETGAAYVTSVSATNGAESWRDHRNGGGVIAEVPSGEIIARGFSMPHSPRMRNGELWCCNSGSGHLCRIDRKTGEVERVAWAPGFLRGLGFVGDYAVVGSSRPREGDLYSGLELDDALAAAGEKPKLGLFVIDLRSGEVVEWLFIDGPMRELFDVTVLPGVRRPMALGLIAPEIKQRIYFDSNRIQRDPDGSWTPGQVIG